MGEIRNGDYISQYSGDEIDKLLTTTVWQSNENLLDNWDFSNADNIVDQRGGKVVPTGTPWWTSADSVPSSGTSGSGGTAQAYRQITVTGTNSGGVSYVGWVVSGTTYYTRAEYAVRGYYATAPKYTIDKCRLIAGALIIEDSCLHLVGTQTYSNMRFPLEVARFVPGETYTVSAIILDSSGVTSGNAYFSTYINGTETNYKSIRQTGLFTTQITMPSSFTTLSICFVSSSASGKDLRIKAIKVEKGIQQTIAHNEGTEENTVWVLNEHQKYVDELQKCQYYAEGGIAATLLTPSGGYDNVLPFKATKRIAPTLTLYALDGTPNAVSGWSGSSWGTYPLASNWSTYITTTRFGIRLILSPTSVPNMTFPKNISFKAFATADL